MACYHVPGSSPPLGSACVLLVCPDDLTSFRLVRLWAGECFAVCVCFSALSGGALNKIRLHYVLILEQNCCKNKTELAN